MFTRITLPATLLRIRSFTSPAVSEQPTSVSFVSPGLSSFAGFRKCRLVVVFDGYKVKGNPGEKGHFHNIQVVYTKENQTADAYIEALVDQIGKNYAVKVATSDGLVQLGSLRSGVLRMSARELKTEMDLAAKEMAEFF